MKLNNPISASDSSFKSHKTHAVKDILDAGGATAFGIKSGKNNQTLIDARRFD